MIKKSIICLLLCLFTLSFASCENEKEKAVNQLSKEIDQINEQLPQQIDEYTVWETSVLDENNLIFNYTLQEQFLEEGAIDTLEENKQILKSNIEANLNASADFKAIVTLLESAGLGIVYHFAGSVSGKTFDITFTPEEVSAL